MAEPGDVNNFRGNFEKLYREYMQQRPAALPGGGSGGPPAPPGGREMAPMPEGPGAQPGGRTYYSNVPSTNVRPPIDISEVSRARPMGGALGPSALAAPLGIERCLSPRCRETPRCTGTASRSPGFAWPSWLRRAARIPR